MEEEREEQLRAVQDGRVFPVGQALRHTFDADNHDTLGSDVTGLMIDLSRIPYDRVPEQRMTAGAPVAVAAPVPSPPVAAAPARGWLGRIGDLFGRG